MINQERFEEAIEWLFLLPLGSHRWKDGSFEITSKQNFGERALHVVLTTKEDRFLFRFSGKPRGRFFAFDVSYLYPSRSTLEDAMEKLVEAIETCIASLSEEERAQLLAGLLQREGREQS